LNDVLAVGDNPTVETKEKETMPAPHRRDSAPAEDPLRKLRNVVIKLYSKWVSKTYPFACQGPNLSIHYGSDVSRSHAHRINLGASVVVHKDVTLRVQVPLENQGDAVLVIGDGCVFEPRAIISAKNYIELGRDVVLGPAVLIQDHSHAYKDVTLTIRQQGATEGGKIRIGEGCWIGDGSVIHCDQGELTLGPNCLVAPNSLVNRSFPAYSLIAGNPAHVVKQFDPVKGVWVLGSYRPADAEPVQQVPVRAAGSSGNPKS
jgi:acetyltransferase-like isoleucine patch superfamily enzyme